MLQEEKTSVKDVLNETKHELVTPGPESPSLDPTWNKAWKIPSFRRKLWIGLVILAAIFTALPFFFQAIEARSGYFFTDLFLQWLPAYNVSIAVFFLIWSCCLILVIRIYRDPMIMLVTLWAYNGVTLARMACIGLISLNPPAGLIPMADPITNQFYGAHYITHDLFFSGHTTTVFLIFLCLKKKTDRLYALLASVILGFLLLIQHVHYTVDVLAAPVFTYAVFRLALLFTEKEKAALIPARKN
jgi:hypothetical protein